MSIALDTTIALVDLATAKVFLNIASGTTTHDEILNLCINAVSDFAKRECRTVLVSTAITEYHDGDGSNFIIPRNIPIISITKVWDDTGRAFTDGEEIAAADLVVTHDDKRITYDGGIFTIGVGNVKATYTVGYATIPWTLQEFCLETVRIYFRDITEKRDGITARTIAGGSITTVSEDIADLFDSSRSTYLGASAISTITMFNDSVLSELHMIVPGSYEYVWDMKRNKWFQIVRGTELYGGAPFADTNGYRYCYGYNNAGFVMRLENGTAFDTTSIAHTLRTGDMALAVGGRGESGSIMAWSKVNWFDLVAKAKTVTDQNIAMVYFNDTGTASYGATTITPLRSGYRLINTPTHNKDIQTTFHGFQFSISTDDETIGFEPLYLGIRYSVFPRELS